MNRRKFLKTIIGSILFIPLMLKSKILPSVMFQASLTTSKQRYEIKRQIMETWPFGFSSLFDGSSGRHVFVIVTRETPDGLYEVLMQDWAKFCAPHWLEKSEGEILKYEK